MSHLDEGQLHELLDGELDQPARAAALAHLASCDRCKAAYDEAAAFLAESDALIERVQLPAALESRTSKIVAAAAAPVSNTSIADAKSRNRLRAYRTFAWAATVVVAVGVGWYGGNLSRAPQQAATAVADEMGAASARIDSASRSASDAVPSPVIPPVAKQAAPGSTANQLAQRAPAADAPAAPTDKASSTDNVAASRGEAKERASETENDAAGLMHRDAPAASAQPVPAPAPAVEEPARPELRRRLADNAKPAAPVAALSASGAAAGFDRKDEFSATAFRVIGMEEAVRILGGSIRLIDGMGPSRILSGRLAGGDSAGLVRVVYEDPPGRELWLDQRREASLREERASRATALLPGDTLMVLRTAGGRSLGWIDEHGFVLRLTGFLPADSLQALRVRIR